MGGQYNPLQGSMGLGQVGQAERADNSQLGLRQYYAGVRFPNYYWPEQNYQWPASQLTYDEMMRFVHKYSNPSPEETARRKEKQYPDARIKRQEQLEDMKRSKEEDGVVINDWLIGCDPEFVGLNTLGHLVNLSRALPHEGEVGYDHGGYVGEFRPKPTHGTYALTKRIQGLIKGEQVQKVLESGVRKLRAGAYVHDQGGERLHVSLGGHLHLDINPVDKDGNFTKEHKARITALDNVVAALEHLDILPAREAEARRKDRNGYGRYGDVRLAATPGKAGYRTEYRTMASWLHDPKVAYLCLTLGKLAASNPETAKALKGVTSFEALEDWVRPFGKADDNAKRAISKVFSLGHKALVIDPEGDFYSRWRTLGL